MTSSEVIAYYSVIHKGDWASIWDSLHSQNEPDEEEVRKVLKSIKSKWVTVMDDDYPEQLKSIYRPPYTLFYHGDLSIISNKYKGISVVGARENTRYGAAVTRNLVRKLSKELYVVSGMARGIDGIAHRTCIEVGGKTVCVLGCGINVCYPVSNLDIYDEAKKHHLIISEYPNCTQPCQAYFPIRNRIIAGLTNCLLVTEGKKRSGTSITATVTLQNGGNVCCVPTKIQTDSICNHLIAYGARLVETVDDIYDEMGYSKSEPIF